MLERALDTAWITDVPGEVLPVPSAPARARWVAQRMYLEACREQRLRRGLIGLPKPTLFRFGLQGFAALLRLLRLYQRGVRNSLDIRLQDRVIDFPNLPSEFDGFTILHLSDLHIDAHPDMADRLMALISGIAVDALVLTGDYRYRVRGEFEHVMPAIQAISQGVRVSHGRFAILGNHDPATMAAPLETAGYRVLLNETVALRRAGQAITLTGLDDVHYFYTDEAIRALRAEIEGFRIVLMHSPELIAEAAAAGVSLYLTGHTHAGQICLPGGWPIVSNASAGRRFASGVWRHGAMTGFTSPGVGVSGLPVRFFSRGEATRLVLRRRAA